MLRQNSAITADFNQVSLPRKFCMSKEFLIRETETNKKQEGYRLQTGSAEVVESNK